jgi:hypothetical protein
VHCTLVVRSHRVGEAHQLTKEICPLFARKASRKCSSLEKTLGKEVLQSLWFGEEVLVHVAEQMLAAPASNA